MQKNPFLPEFTIEKFNALEPAEKRKAVARDALAQIATKRFVPKSNVYFHLEDLQSHRGEELRDVLIDDAHVKECRVCGLGACFASIVRLGDELRVEQNMTDEPSSNTISKGKSVFDDKLLSIFGRKQLDLIEAAFEETYIWCTFTRDDQDEFLKSDLMQSAVKFGRKYASNRALLHAILQNIADSDDGTFDPSR